MKKLWCDLRSDAERYDYILSGQAYDAGIIAHAIQADVAMAFHRCSEYDAEVRKLREENERLRNDAERYRWLRESVKKSGGIIKAQSYFWNYGGSRKRLDAAIDAARGAK